MSSFAGALTRARTRLFAMSPFIAAGAVASVVTASDPLVGTVVAVLQTLAGLAGNIAASDVHATLSERVLQDDVLKNHDLAHAVRNAVCAVIRETAREITDQHERATLEKVASVDEIGWTEAEATLWLPQAVEGFSVASGVEMFSRTPEEFASFKALELDDWRSIVGGLAAVSAVALEGDIISSTANLTLSRKTVDLVSARLHETFPRALYEILKADFAHDGKAYGGLLIKLVGHISAKQVETLNAAYENLSRTEKILFTLERTEVKVDRTVENTEKILEELGSFRDESARSSPARLTPNLPPRNQIFTGRRTVLDELKAELEKSGRAALSGLPGVGMTQTAIEYAHELHAAQAYDYVIYARAATETELLADFQRAATELNLPAKDNADLNLVAAAVKAWLGRAEKWLLIFDNADDLRVVRQHTPANTKGHTLLTRRPGDAGGFARTIKIEEMGADEGALLLLRRAGLVRGIDTLDGVAPAIAEQARAIAREMDGLPLSLDIAGAFLKETSTRIDEYLGLYRTEGRQLRQERDQNALYYEHSVATVFALAFKQVAEPDDDTEESAVIARAAADLLRLCAFLAPDAIPLELILVATPALGEDLQRAPDNKIWRKKTVAKATRFSLLDANPEKQTYDMHREVQAVMRDELDDETQCLWAERALQTLETNFPDVTVFANWETCDLLLPNALDCLKHGDRLKIETKAVALLKNQTGLHLVNRVRYVEAEPLYKQALELRKNLLDMEHPSVAASMNNLAGLYRAQGRYEEAEPLFEHASATLEKFLGVNHRHTILVRENFEAFKREKAARES
jgi:tetratricopeptide (TPR) repeat protein